MPTPLFKKGQIPWNKNQKMASLIPRYVSHRKTHGLAGTPIYKVWTGMLTRCYNKKDAAYRFYGARGIKMCRAWLKFGNFYKDMSYGYRRGLSIERIDNDDNYKPANCKWITKREQARNRRSTIVFRGETATEASKRLGFSSDTIAARIRSGWNIRKAFTSPAYSKKHD